MQKLRTGFTLMELLIYIAVLTMAIGAIIALIISGMEIINRIKIVHDVRSSATMSLERMTREIQASDEIDTVSSSFDTSPGSIVLLSEDDSGVVTETEFTVESGEIVVYKDGVLRGSLVSESIEMDSLVFRHITHGATESVKIEATFSARDADPDRTDTFYTTVLVRGAY